MARFSIGFARLLPFIGYHHILIFFCLIAIVLTSLALAGSTSNASLIPQLYVISLKYGPNTSSIPTGNTLIRPESLQLLSDLVPSNATLRVNVGYFGICYTLQEPNYVCSRSISWLASQLSAEQDPLNLIWQGQRFKNHVLFSPFFFISLAFLFIAVLLLFTFPGWHESSDDDDSEREIKPFPARPVANMALALTTISAILLLISALWTHISAVAFAEGMHALAPNRVDTQLGTANITLNWVAFSLTTLVTIGLMIMILSIKLLDRLIDDDYSSTGIVEVIREKPNPSTLPPPPPPPMFPEAPARPTHASTIPVARNRVTRWDGDE